jgi:glucose/arabinose dehydrogenase
MTSIGTRAEPVAIRHAGDGSNRLFIVERAGRLQVLNAAGTLSLFMNITTSVRSTGGEQGLLGLAFPPGFAAKQYFYVAYTRQPDGALTLARYRTDAINPAIGDPASGAIILTIPHAANSNHNGCDIAFGPDGFLYWSTGDGGGAGDTANNAQNPTQLLGKMLCLDVEGSVGGPAPYLIPLTNPWAAATDGVADEILHLGLRNPWRFSFDRRTGDLWLSDVGQSTAEEVNRTPRGTLGLNYGWRRREGMNNFDLSQPMGVGVVTEPLLQILASAGNRSITGGYVSRGARFPRMDGIYFFGDYVAGRLYATQPDRNGVWRQATLRTDAAAISTFGEDEAGGLYWANVANGRVYRIEDDRDAAYLTILSHSTNPAGQVTFTFGTAIGKTYICEVSNDLATWSPVGSSIVGTAAFQATFNEPTLPPTGIVRRYWRAREL